MLDMGFLPSIKRILGKLPGKRQTLLFSATFEDALKKLALEMLRDPREVQIAARNTIAEKVTHRAHPVDGNRKRDLLIEILIQDRKDGAPAYEKIIRNPPADPSDAMAELIYANVDIIRTAPDKRLWREIFGAVALSHDRERDAFDRNHQSFKSYIKRLLQHFVNTRRLPADYPLDVAADLIFALNAHNLRRLAASQSCTPEDIRDITRKQMRLLLRQDDGDSARRRPASSSRRSTSPKKKTSAAAKAATLKGQAHVQDKT